MSRPFTIALGVEWAASDVFELILVCKMSKGLRRVLWSVVVNHDLWDSMSRENTFGMENDFSCSAAEMCDFNES